MENEIEFDDSTLVDESTENTEQIEQTEDEDEIDFASMSPEEKADYIASQEEKEPQEEEDKFPEKEVKDETPKKEPQKKESSNDTIKVKINGKEEEVKIQDLVNTYQKDRSGDENFRKASYVKKQAIEIQKETNALIDKIKDHPLEVLSHLGIDIDELAEKRIWEKIQYEQMTDEERETYEAKQKLKYYEEQENVRRQQEEYHRNQQAKQFHLEQFNKQILTEIEKNNLPKDTSTYKKFVVIVQKAIQNQLPVTFADIAQLVKEDLEKEDRRLVERYKKKDVNSLIEELGEETIKAIQQEQIKKLKNPYVTTVNPTKGTMTKIKKGKGSLDDWFNGLNNGY